MALAQLLVEQNFPAIAIHRTMPQEERLSRYQQFKNFQKRILVATNLFGRGMDIERVNIVFNYDMPEDSDTYLHRVARAGRFGTKGLAITFVSDEADVRVLNQIQERFVVNITELPDEIDISTYSKSRDLFLRFKIYFKINKFFNSISSWSKVKVQMCEVRWNKFVKLFSLIGSNNNNNNNNNNINNNEAVE